MNMPKMPPLMMIEIMVQQYPNLRPVWQQTKQMVKGKDEKQIEHIIKNTAQTEGLDLNEALSLFAQTFGLNTNVKPF